MTETLHFRNVLRVTKSNQLQSVGSQENNNTFLGHRGRDFEFEQLNPLKVQFLESIAKEGNQLDEIKNWLESMA